MCSKGRSGSLYASSISPCSPPVAGCAKPYANHESQSSSLSVSWKENGLSIREITASKWSKWTLTRLTTYRPSSGVHVPFASGTHPVSTDATTTGGVAPPKRSIFSIGCSGFVLASFSLSIVAGIAPNGTQTWRLCPCSSGGPHSEL